MTSGNYECKRCNNLFETADFPAACGACGSTQVKPANEATAKLNAVWKLQKKMDKALELMRAIQLYEEAHMATATYIRKELETAMRLQDPELPEEFRLNISDIVTHFRATGELTEHSLVDAGMQYLYNLTENYLRFN